MDPSPAPPDRHELMESHTSHPDILVEQIAELARSQGGAAMPSGLQITAHTDIMRDLKLDSLAVMDFIMALELRFNTLIPIDSMADLRTVGDLAGLLHAQGRQAVTA